MKKGRSFWKWLYLWARAGVINDIREKRINQEILESMTKIWDEECKDYVDEDDYREPSADESSAVGYFGSDCGDGGDCGDGSAI